MHQRRENYLRGCCFLHQIIFYLLVLLLWSIHPVLDHLSFTLLFSLFFLLVSLQLLMFGFSQTPLTTHEFCSFVYFGPTLYVLCVRLLQTFLIFAIFPFIFSAFLSQFLSFSLNFLLTNHSLDCYQFISLCLLTTQISPLYFSLLHSYKLL